MAKVGNIDRGFYQVAAPDRSFKVIAKHIGIQAEPGFKIIINNKTVTIGKTGILEFELDEEQEFEFGFYSNKNSSVLIDLR